MNADIHDLLSAARAARTLSAQGGVLNTVVT